MVKAARATGANEVASWNRSLIPRRFCMDVWDRIAEVDNVLKSLISDHRAR